jgi:hypothetical protein
VLNVEALLHMNGISVDAARAREFSEGIIAELIWTNSHTEGQTGGDFGIVIERPAIVVADDRVRDHIGVQKQGLVVQAKRRKYGLGIGKLTASQQDHLPENSTFYALLLYECEDRENTAVGPFRWCSDPFASPDTVRGWIEAPTNTFTSKGIVIGLAGGKLGTPDEANINRFIFETGIPPFRVIVRWRDARPNHERLQIINRSTGRLTTRQGE